MSWLNGGLYTAPRQTPLLPEEHNGRHATASRETPVTRLKTLEKEYMALVGHYSLHAYKICIFEPQDNGTEQNKNV